MGSNLVAPNSALLQQNLASRVANESWGYGKCCIRVWVRMAKGWLGWTWIDFDRKFAIKTLIFQWNLKFPTFWVFLSNQLSCALIGWIQPAKKKNRFAAALWLAVCRHFISGVNQSERCRHKRPLWLVDPVSIFDLTEKVKSDDFFYKNWSFNG